jgi:hypothetical protein
MTENDDWFTRSRETADRLRMLEEAATTAQPPKTVKRVASYMPPSGAPAKSMNSQNARMRVQKKRGMK